MRSIERVFRKNNNAEIQLSLLARFLQNSGHKSEIAKQTVDEMVRNGSLNMPRNDYVKLTPRALHVESDVIRTYEAVDCTVKPALPKKGLSCAVDVAKPSPKV